MKSSPQSHDLSPPTMTVTVKWARERISFELPAPETPLSAIRASLADYTLLPPNAFKLVHAGVVMKDDAAPISAYRLHSNSVIALIGTADSSVPLPPPPLRAEQPIVTAIRAELAQVRATLAPALATFLQDPTHHKEHLRLGELLLQALIRLDDIAPEPAWEHARRERKEAVREVQHMLDRLDDAWAARTN